MPFTSLFVSLLALSGFVLFRKLVNASERRCRLEQAGQMSTWDNVERQAQFFVKIVQTDFGYGKEIWAFSDGGFQIDLELRAFKSGHLIHPSPKLPEVERYCEVNGISLTRTLVK